MKWNSHCHQVCNLRHVEDSKNIAHDGFRGLRFAFSLIMQSKHTVVQSGIIPLV